MARILVLADAGSHTGFATVTHNIGDRLVRDYGHDLHVLAANWRGDHVDTAMKLYLPTQLMPADLYGQSRFVELIGKIVPDAILVINDPAVLLNFLFNNPHDTEKVLLNGFQVADSIYRPPIIAYLTADGYDSPRSWNLLASRTKRIAMTKFGRDTAMPEAPVIWHGVDHEVFRPRDKREAKAMLGFDPDRFLVLRVDKNSPRKDYPATWKALRSLLRKYKDIDVHFHCLPRALDGYDLNAVRWNDEDIRDRVTFSPQLTGYAGWGQEMLAALYAAADIFVSTSWGEGFGLTILEAMSSGTPVVAQNHSAITEVVGDGGVLIEPMGRITTPMGQEQCLPDIPAFTAAIERLYLGRGSIKKLGIKARAQAERCSWDYAAKRFDEIIREEVERALQQPERSPEGNPLEVR